MEEKTSFNIALFPQDKQLIYDCIKLAQGNFSAQSEDYLLGDNAWPHITLCQFEIEPEHIAEVWHTVSSLQPASLAIRFDHIYTWPGKKDHIDKYWLGLAVTKAPQLMELQIKVCEKLNKFTAIDNDPDSHYLPGNYFPHLTWARCSGSKSLNISFLPSSEFWSQSYSFSLSLGESGQNGMYRRTLFP